MDWEPTIVTWDQALFSFRFENYIPEGKAKPISAVAVRENVWEPLKLGLISGNYDRNRIKIDARFEDAEWRGFFVRVCVDFEMFLFFFYENTFSAQPGFSDFSNNPQKCSHKLLITANIFPAKIYSRVNMHSLT